MLQLAEIFQDEPSLKHKPVLMNRKRTSVTILGCMLHSFEAEAIVSKKVNDFRRIVGRKVADHVAEHATDVEWWLKEVIKKIRGHKISLTSGM